MRIGARRCARCRLAALAIGALSWLEGAGGAALARAQSSVTQTQAPAKGKGKRKGAASHVSPVVEACVEHHTDAQELRMAGKLLESRAELRQCAAEACPALLQRDCVGWLDQIEPQIPSLTFRVTVGGKSWSDMEVFIDGALANEPSMGKAIDLDPGPHTVRVLVAGLAPFEERVILNEGERYRMIEVPLAAPARKPPEMHRPVPLATYVLGGVAVAGAVSGAIWAAQSVTLRDELEHTCAPACSEGRVDELRTRALLADISWGVSALSLVGATTFFLLRPELPVEVDVALGPEGGLGVLRIDAF